MSGVPTRPGRARMRSSLLVSRPPLKNSGKRLLFSDSMEALGRAKPPRGGLPQPTAVSVCFAFGRLAFLTRGPAETWDEQSDS